MGRETPGLQAAWPALAGGPTAWWGSSGSHQALGAATAGPAWGRASPPCFAIRPVHTREREEPGRGALLEARRSPVLPAALSPPRSACAGGCSSRTSCWCSCGSGGWSRRAGSRPAIESSFQSVRVRGGAAWLQPQETSTSTPTATQERSRTCPGVFGVHRSPANHPRDARQQPRKGSPALSKEGWTPAGLAKSEASCLPLPLEAASPARKRHCSLCQRPFMCEHSLSSQRARQRIVDALHFVHN